MPIKKALDWSEIDRAIINLAGDWIGLGDLIVTIPLLIGIQRTNPKCKIELVLTKNRIGSLDKLLPVKVKIINVPKVFYHYRFLAPWFILRMKRPRERKIVYFYDFMAPRKSASLFGKWMRADFIFGYGFDDKKGEPVNNVTELPYLVPGKMPFDYSKQFELITGMHGPWNPKLAVDLPVREKAKQWFMQNGINSKQKILAIHPGCHSNYSVRRWPLDYFIKVAKEFISHCKGEVLFLIGPEELSLKRQLFNTLFTKNVKFIENVALINLAGILSNCDCLLTNDSGIMHLAFSVGMPGVALFGPTKREKYQNFYPNAVFIQAPYACEPCHSTHRYKECHVEPPPCMQSIAPKMVFESIKSILSRCADKHRTYISEQELQYAFKSQVGNLQGV